MSTANRDRNLAVEVPRVDNTRPRPGDLLVSKQRLSRYVLSVVPGKPQLRHAKSEHLSALARRYAEHLQVDCWLRSDGAYTRIGRYRQTGQTAADHQNETRQEMQTRWHHKNIAQRVSA